MRRNIAYTIVETFLFIMLKVILPTVYLVFPLGLAVLDSPYFLLLYFVTIPAYLLILTITAPYHEED